jgi:hypothetical protein
LCEDPSLITDQVFDELAGFVVSVLRRIYRYWYAGEEPQAIPPSKWGGFADRTDDEALFEKALTILAQVAPDVKETADRWKSPLRLTAGGRLTHRIGEVCQYLNALQLPKPPRGWPMKWLRAPSNKALHLTAIPLRSIAAGELYR